MVFNFFKHKSKNSPRTFEGTYISDEEILDMIHSKKESPVKKEIEDIRNMFDELKHLVNNG